MKRIFKEDLTGRRFGRLVALERDIKLSQEKHRSTWKCQCDCGNVTFVEVDRLKSNHTQSCGCYKKSRAIEANREQNVYALKDGYYEVTDTCNRTFLISASDYEYCRQYYWRVNDGGYVVRANMGKKIRLARELLNAPSNLYVDHINHNRLDNRRENLRLVTMQQNNCNRAGRGSSTGITGVYYEHNGYVVRVNQLYIGRRPTLKEAVRLREKAVKEHQGEYAYDPTQDVTRQ